MMAAGARVEIGDVAGATRDLKEIAVELIEKNRPADAIEALREAAGLTPDDDEIRERLLDVYVASGDFARARECASTPEQLKGLAQLLEAGGHEDAALDALGEAARRDPEDSELRARLARAFVARGDVARAREYASTPEQLKELAVDLEAGGHEDAALDALSEAARLDPEDSELRARLARAFVARGDLATAAQYLTVETAGDDPQLLFTVAEIKLRGETPDDGLAIVRRLLEQYPDRREEVALLGWTVAEQAPELGFNVVRAGGRSRCRPPGLGIGGGRAAGVRDPRAQSHPRADAPRGDLRRWRTRGDDVQRAGAAGRRLHRGRTGGRGAVHRRRPRRARAVGSLQSGTVPSRARAARRAGSRSADRRAIERPIAVHDHRSVSGFERVPLEHGARRIHGARFIGAADDVDTFGGSARRPWKSRERGRSPGSPGSNVESEPVAEPKSAPKRAAKPMSKPAQPDRDHFQISAHTIDLESILGELESPPAGAPGAAAALGTPAVAHASTESVEVDLSIVLDDIKRPQRRPEAPPAAPAPSDLDGVFAHLRDDASRRSALDEAEQQYKRGLALREAGDVDGCIAALQAASQAPKLRFATASILARIFRDRGVNRQAVEWFEKAAQAPAPTAQEGHDLLYDLADALEKEGETARALAVALELQADAGDYRDVAARIDRLTKVQARG